MTIENRERMDLAESELVVYIKKFAQNLDDITISQIAKEIVELIDWNNSALMHKGFSWMAKNYLNKKKMI